MVSKRHSASWGQFGVVGPTAYSIFFLPCVIYTSSDQAALWESPKVPFLVRTSLGTHLHFGREDSASAELLVISFL